MLKGITNPDQFSAETAKQLESLIEVRRAVQLLELNGVEPASELQDEDVYDLDELNEITTGILSKMAKDDFILTIDSDSDSEPIQPESDSEHEVAPQPKKSKSKKNKRQAQQPEEEEVENDLNPDFKFAIDDLDTSSKFDGWDFQVDNNSKNVSKDVDLDGILRRKGGLSGLAGGEEEENDSEEEQEEQEEDEEEEEEEEQDEEVEDEDDEDLALDGFGMGANEQESEEEEDSEDEAEAEEPEDNEDAEEEPVEADMDAEHPSDSEEPEEDSAEAIAEFYGDDQESTQAKSQVHTTFQTLQLSRPVLKGLSQLGYVKPSPIQSASIPIALLGKDIVAGAQTGSGKTAAYMIPIIERLLYKPSKVPSTRVIVLTPTRELAIQVCDVGKKLSQFINNLNFGLAVGGLNLRQQELQLKTRPDIVIATPGRLIDHIRNSPSFTIDNLEVLVIDEADRMLDEGFQAELTEILSLIPKYKRQTLLFSATMNTKIQDLIQLSLQKPIRIMIDPPKTAASKLIQEFVRIRKRDHLKPALLFQLIKTIDPKQQNRIVVFVSRKEMAHKLRIIMGLLGMKVSELHGSLTQEQRLKNVLDFKNLVVPVLICTDLASRGLDIPKIEIVVNYDMPKTHEVYLHRVGRTARAGRDGVSISFVGESTQDRSIVKDAIKSIAETNEGKAVSRNVDWTKVESINKIIESKQDTIEEVLVEEKQAKEILQAEMELTKASNIIKHGKEIQARPRRTWFESEAEKKKHKTEVMQHLTKHGKKVNSKKRKQLEAKKEDNNARSYKKTKVDRSNNQKNPKRNAASKKTKKRK
ncbi:ATP-dependent RNA helicase DRS1 [Spathaspora sp. JA1]|nr:ATP-dependent RNA helicase DRS1 [Spathaspora sp. JA1]